MKARLKGSLRMRRLVTATAALFALALSACSSTAPAPTSNVTTRPTSTGVLVAKSTTVNLGNVPFDKLVEGQFELVNSGTQPVKLIGLPQVKMLEGC